MRIETERLILRKPKKEDWKSIFEACQLKNFSKQTKRIPHPFMKKDAKIFLKKALKKWKNKEYAFFIELKSERKVIGIIYLEDIRLFSKTAETISWINPKYQRKGYVLEAKIAVNDFAFNELGLRKILSYIFSENKASIEVQKKMGYSFEGRMIKNCKAVSTGRIHDVDIYGLFRTDWKKISPKLKKEMNKKLTS